jgi:DNA-nicking Smr family endonuclease
MADDPVEIPIEYELDLHAFHPRDVRAVVDEFVTAARAKGLQDVRLVHGRGRVVQRAQVQDLLERHPAVTSFTDDPRAHLGATLVRLRPAAAPDGDEDAG